MARKPTYLADFDSAMGMLRALSRALHGRDFPLPGTLPPWTERPMLAVGALVNRLPKRVREQVYIWSGWFEAISTCRLDRVDANAVAEWIVSLYPKRRYPAIAIGSANGAATHLWAALAIPWLPQTVLVPVARSGIHPDEPQRELQWAAKPSRVILERNPDLQLHHMHDPVQDRLMVQRMSYFRFKRRVLGAAYERFLEECLEPGGTIIIVECGMTWPVTDCGERCVFQFGAFGGATVEEMQHGGPRVRDYLQRYRSHRRRWEPPAADRQAPEAEGGFEPALRDDILRIAARRGWRVRRLLFDNPEDLSPLTADFYLQWNRTRGIEDRRLLVESFILMEPYWTIRTGAVPFWMVFNTEPSLNAMEAYLGRRAFAEIFIMLFSHGVESIGVPPIGRWRELLRYAQSDGAFLGVDERAFPRDFGVYTRYHHDLIRRIRARYRWPAPAALKELDEFFVQERSRSVQWIETE